MKQLKTVCEKALADRLAGRTASHRCAACRDEAEALLAGLKAPRWSRNAPEDALQRIRTAALDRIEGPSVRPSGPALGLATAAVFAAWIAFAPRVEIDAPHPRKLASAGSAALRPPVPEPLATAGSAAQPHQVPEPLATAGSAAQPHQVPEPLATADLDFLESLDMMEGLDDTEWELMETFEEEDS